MGSYHIFRRLEAEICILQVRPYMAKAQIITHLFEEQGNIVATRTIERDFKVLKRDFGIEIIFDRDHGGYTLDDTSQHQIINFLQFVSRIHLGDLLRDSLKTFSTLEGSVKLENNSDFTGLDHIPAILTAIHNNFEISFSHENYHQHTHKPYQITPLQLREYQGRWYVVGVPKAENHIKTFGLARISKLYS